MLMQSLIVALIVLACALYAAWSLMPAAARRGIAAQLLKLPLPGALQQVIEKHSLVASGCACDGCDGATGKPAGPKVQIVRFQPRVRQ